jgi:hypothetical protein
MQIKDYLDTAVADMKLDSSATASQARQAGQKLRRRRSTLVAVSIAAAVVTGTGAWVAWPASPPNHPRAPETSVAVGPLAVPESLSGETGPVSGRGMVAALVASIEQVDADTDARFAEFRGTAGSGRGFEPGGEPMAKVMYSNDGDGMGAVRVTLSPLNGLVSGQVGQPPYGCKSYMSGCTVTALPNGDFLRTYVDHESGDLPGTVMNIVEVISSARQMRLSVSSSTAGAGDSGLVREQPALGIGELSDIAVADWWSRTTLPVEYLELGEDLPSFEELCTVEGSGGNMTTQCH